MLRWQLVADGDVVLDGEADELGDLAPGSSLVLSVEDVAPQWSSKVSAGAGVWWVVRAVRRDGAEGSADGPLELGAGQTCLQRATSPDEAVGAVHETDDGYTVGPVVVDRRGRLTRVGAAPVREARVDAWRAPTDNDLRAPWNLGTPDADAWAAAGLTRLHERVDSVQLEGDTLVVTARTAGSGHRLRPRRRVPLAGGRRHDGRPDAVDHPPRLVAGLGGPARTARRAGAGRCRRCRRRLGRAGSR